MGRKKANLQLIENDKARKVSYTKRVKGIVRKTQELSVMCGVDACAVIYGPYSQAPVVWPSSEAEARRILTNFKRKPEVDQSQRQFDQAALAKENLAKAQEKLMKLRKKNREMQMENIITEIFQGRMNPEQVPPSDLGDLLWVLEDKMKKIEHRKNLAKCIPPGADNTNAVIPNEDAAVLPAGKDAAVIPAGEDAVVTGKQDAGGAICSYIDNEDYGLSAVVRQSLTLSESRNRTLGKNQMEAGSSSHQA